MRTLLVVTAAIAFAAAAAAESGDRRKVTDPDAKVPATEFQSAFEGYRPFADEERRDWRKSNEEVGAAGGYAGRRPGQDAGQQPSKPQAGAPESSGGHGGHK
jgi:hypothetical protein